MPSVDDVRTRWLPVLALAVLAPVCAEYLWAYDDSTGHPGTLLGNLVIFTPLYGCPALLIREVARRRGLGWPGIVLLAAAFGVVEAGLVDQSMFAREYRGIPYWSDMADPTYVAPIGLSVFLAVTFVMNHVLASMAGPIAVVEGLAGTRGRDPWLGRPMIALLVLLYAGASALVYADMLDTNGEAIASPGQVAGAGVAALLLVAAGLATGRLRQDLAAGSVPRPWLVALLAAAATGATLVYGPSPLGTDALLATYVVAGGLVWWISRRPAWTAGHVAALATGWLVAFAIGAFATDPIGHVTDVEKLGHHLALLLLVAVVGALAVRRAAAGSLRKDRVSVTG
jgi:hypothetical protein